MELQKNQIDLNELKNIKLVVCSDENGIKIIKTYPEIICIELSELTKRYQNTIIKSLRNTDKNCVIRLDIHLIQSDRYKCYELTK